MSRLYSGNIADHRKALERLEDMGFMVELDKTYTPHTLSNSYWLNIRETGYGPNVISRWFTAKDENLLYNDMTAWLNRQADALSYWR